MRQDELCQSGSPDGQDRSEIEGVFRTNGRERRESELPPDKPSAMEGLFGVFLAPPLYTSPSVKRYN